MFIDQFVNVDFVIIDVLVVVLEIKMVVFLLLFLFLLFVLVVKEIFKVVEDMLCFFGCEDLGIKEEKKVCFQVKMFEFIYSNICYLVMVCDNNIFGIVVICFVVDEDGSIGSGEIVWDIGGDCGKEVFRVVNLMNDLFECWMLGKQCG